MLHIIYKLRLVKIEVLYMNENIINMTCLDGWNFYSYNGLPEDNGTGFTTVAFKNMGKNYIVKKDWKTNFFFCEISLKNKVKTIKNIRLSSVLAEVDKIIDR